jgi:hypothetical protein
VPFSSVNGEFEISRKERRKFSRKEEELRFISVGEVVFAFDLAFPLFPIGNVQPDLPHFPLPPYWRLASHENHLCDRGKDGVRRRLTFLHQPIEHKFDPGYLPATRSSDRVRTGPGRGPRELKRPLEIEGSCARTRKRTLSLELKSI